VRLLYLAWLRWCRDNAACELDTHWMRADAEPVALVHVMRRRNHLNSRVAALEA
jgi:hypothetical protein